MGYEGPGGNGVMGIIGTLFGGGVAGIADAVDKVAGRFKASFTEKSKAALDERKLDLEFDRLADAGDERQTAVNLQEAQHPSVFVAGWRPFVGWVSSLGFGVHVIVIPIAKMLTSIWAPEVEMPEFDTVLILTILGGVLGIGKSLRTVEKLRGAERSRIWPAK